MKLSRMLYKAARMSNDIEALTSGSPRRIARRGANKAIGRTAARAGLFRALFGSGAPKEPKP